MRGKIEKLLLPGRRHLRAAHADDAHAGPLLAQGWISSAPCASPLASPATRSSVSGSAGVPAAGGRDALITESLVAMRQGLRVLLRDLLR